MDLPLFMQSFKFMDVSVDIEHLHHAYMMEHDATQWYPGTSKYCGKSCAKQTVKFTSDVAQTVYIAAHSWYKKMAPTKCNFQTGTVVNEMGKRKQHFMKVGSDKNPWVNRDAILFKSGEGPSKKVYEVQAGETLTVEVEYDFSDSKAIRDWSVVAWSTEKKLTVTDPLAA